LEDSAAQAFRVYALRAALKGRAMSKSGLRLAAISRLTRGKSLLYPSFTYRIFLSFVLKFRSDRLGRPFLTLEHCFLSYGPEKSDANETNGNADRLPSWGLVRALAGHGFHPGNAVN
jgi:hypothetical protein